MKKLILAVLGILLFATACNKMDGKSTGEPAGKVLQNKTWRMTGYYEEEVDRLIYFTGYAFTFKDDGSIFAKRDSVEVYGSYKDTLYQDTLAVPSLKLDFGAGRPFDKINRNWQVVSKTTKEIHLRMKDRLSDPYSHIFFRINY